MSKKPGNYVQWKTSKEIPTTNRVENVCQAAWESLSLLLLVFVALSMLVRITVRFRMTARTNLCLSLVIVGTVMVFEVFLQSALHSVAEKKRGKLFALCKAFFGLIGAGILWKYYADHKTELQGGLSAVKGILISRYNRLYGAQIASPSGNSDDIPLALCYLAISCFIALYLFSGIGKRKWTFLVFPAISTALLMLMGYAPGGLQILFAATGTLMIHRSHRPRKTWASTIACMLAFALITGGIGFLFQSPAKSLLDHSKQVKAYEERLEGKIKQLFSGTATTKQKDKKVTNESPQYKDAKIMTLIAKERPTGNLYLQDFAAENYENGKWTTSGNDFYEFCESIDIDARQASLYLTSSLCKMTDGSLIDYRLTYQNGYDKSMFLPYGTDVNHLDGLSFSGDVLTRKAAGQKEVQFRAIASNKVEEMTDIRGEWTSEAFYVMVDHARESLVDGPLKWAQSYRGQEELRFWESYNEYVQQTCRETASFVSELPIFDTYSVDLGLDYRFTTTYQMKYSSAAIMNATRLLKRTFNNGDYQYSWNLAKLAYGQDPIEYFLGVSHKGYCMHYASAGVLLFREVGIPARYASGYVVKPSDFKEQEDGTYVAQVIDRNAHAWAEVFLDNIGWIPVELTPGYFNPYTAMPTDKEEAEEREEREERETSEEQSEEQGEEQSKQQSEEAQDPVKQKDQASSEAETGMRTVNVSEDQEEQDHENRGNWLTVILVGAIVFFLGGTMFVCWFSVKKGSKLRRLLGGKYYQSAILLVNGKVYRKLKRSGKILTDKDFENSLRSALGEDRDEEASRYVRIVKEAAFSKGPMSKKDFAFVWHLYQTLK